jgi:hypothetical protein
MCSRSEITGNHSRMCCCVASSSCASPSDTHTAAWIPVHSNCQGAARRTCKCKRRREKKKKRHVINPILQPKHCAKQDSPNNMHPNPLPLNRNCVIDGIEQATETSYPRKVADGGIIIGGDRSGWGIIHCLVIVIRLFLDLDGGIPRGQVFGLHEPRLRLRVILLECIFLSDLVLNLQQGRSDVGDRTLISCNRSWISRAGTLRLLGRSRLLFKRGICYAPFAVPLLNPL